MLGKDQTPLASFMEICIKRITCSTKAGYARSISMTAGMETVSLPIGAPPLKRKREISRPPTRKSKVNSSTSHPSPSANQRRLVSWFENAANTRAGGDGYVRSTLKVLWTTGRWFAVV
jgi:hypothetical protein